MDCKMDYDALKQAGSMIGSGGVIVMDDTTCMVEVLERIAQSYFPQHADRYKVHRPYQAFAQAGRTIKTIRIVFRSPGFFLSGAVEYDRRIEYDRRRGKAILKSR